MQTKNLILRRYQADEKQLLKELLQNELVMKYVGEGVVLTQKQIDDLWERIHKVNYVENKVGVWAVFTTETPEYVGHAAIKPRPENQSEWEIVYFLLPKFWGKGFGSEIARKLVEAGFKTFKLQTVFATVDEENSPSIKILEKAGMRFSRWEFDDAGRFGVYSISAENL